MRRKVVSVLHHSLAGRGSKIGEEEGWGWHFRSAKALREHANHRVVCVRPNERGADWFYRTVEDVPLVLTPTSRFSPSVKFWKYSEFSPQMASYVYRLTSKHDYIPYIHEYRALNSQLVMRKLIEYQMVLQHHGSRPPIESSSSPLPLLKSWSNLRKKKLLRRAKGVIFVLNKAEKSYLEDVLGVEAMVKVRTMGADFEELKPMSEEGKRRLRREIGVPEEGVVLGTFVGVFGDELGAVKGAHLLARVWKELLRRLRGISMIVTGLGASWVKELRTLGVKTYGLLPYEEYLRLLKAWDIYFLPATSGLYYGGVGVAVMEAMALGNRVVSPTLIHFPERDKVHRLGALTPFVNNENELMTFLDNLVYVIENLEAFGPSEIRSLARKYYSWESFAEAFEEALKRV
jgi:glycosyltransferase involved in cell wall biosynthesis